MTKAYFRRLYRRTMDKAYARARGEISKAMNAGGAVLDCGAGSGFEYTMLRNALGTTEFEYQGIEWNAQFAESARAQGLNVVRGDLNQPIPAPDESQRCVFALSVLEHLLTPCRFLSECQRVLEPEGTLVLLTPNISTYFTAALILAGRMPSSGPHPDSLQLLQSEAPVQVSDIGTLQDVESDTPVHRHLVVFSYLALTRYLRMIGFKNVRGHGFGLYPFPNFMQPVLERIDPYHCHQMVFVANKAGSADRLDQ